MVDGADRDILYEVLVESHGCAIARIFQATVELGQEVFLNVDMGPGVGEVFANIEDGISPKRSLQQRVLLRNQIKDERCKLAQLTGNDLFGHLPNEDGDELEACCANTTSIGL